MARFRFRILPRSQGNSDAQPIDRPDAGRSALRELNMPNLPERLGFIYQVKCKDNGKLYIGKAVHPVAQRWKTHCRDAASGRGWLLHNAIRAHQADAFEITTLESVPVSALDEAERKWISVFNSQSPNGYNLTSGGDGIIDPSREVREKMSQSQKGRCANPARREQLGRYTRNAWADPATKEKWTAERLARQTDPVHVQKLRDRSARAWADPEYRKKLAATYATRRITVLSSESRQKISDSLKAHNAIPEVRTRLAAQAKKQWEDPSFRAMKSANSRETINRMWAKRRSQEGSVNAQ